MGIGVAALLGTIPADGMVDLLLVAGAAVATAVTGVAVRERRRIDSLPLVLAERGIRGIARGRAVCGFRSWLGRGRVVKSPSIEVSFRGTDGTDRQLVATLPARVLCGPWIFHVPDPGIDGRFVIRVAVNEGGRDWEALGEWDRHALEEGRFASPVSRVRGRLHWSPDRWDIVEEFRR
jgi:hypothetical protein